MGTQIGIDPYHRFRVVGEDDPCIRRHGGNFESMAAWENVKPHLRETYERILTVYRQEGRPLAPKEICEILGKHPSDLSGRFTELKEMGILTPTEFMYKGSRCLELISPWSERTKEELSKKVVTKEQVLGCIKDLRGSSYHPTEADEEFAEGAARWATMNQDLNVNQLIDIASRIIGEEPLRLSVMQTQFFNMLASKILLVLQ